MIRGETCQRGKPPAQLIGEQVGRCVVESQAMTIRRSRWRLRCPCGELFLAELPTIRKAQKNKDYVCAKCRKAKVA